MEAKQSGSAIDENLIRLVARVSKEWLTFERLRQELLNQGAPDPSPVRAANNDVEKAVLSLLSPQRASSDVERTMVALLHSLSGHPEVARLRFQADKESSELDGAGGALQALLRARDDVFARWNEFQAGMQRVGPTICQVCIDDLASGTGFLISDRHVLTAYHAVRDLISPAGTQIQASDQRLTVVFDNVIVPGASGNAYRMPFVADRQWLISYAPYDASEDRLDGPLSEVATGCLDFVVIRLAEPAGNIAPKYQKGTVRNWIDLSDLATSAAPDTQMLIAHHPGGADLRLSVGLYSNHSQDARRVRYFTPAVVGSSGAPCFNVAWKPYALHNAGYSAAHVNQGVPLALIRQVINAAGGLGGQATPVPRSIPAVDANGNPVLGRWDIAQQLSEILLGKSLVTTMVINSAPKGGKTYTAELVRGILIERGHTAFIFDAERFSADTPERFARRLVDEIAGTTWTAAQPPTPDSRQRARWISQSLSEWTRTQLLPPATIGENASGISASMLWIILDRCDKVMFTQETHDLLVALVADEDMGTTQPVRFVLLGYGGDLAAVPAERVWRANLDLLSIAGVLPYMEHVLAALSISESAETIRDGASSFVSAASNFGINTIPKMVQGLRHWGNARRKRLSA